MKKRLFYSFLLTLLFYLVIIWGIFSDTHRKKELAKLQKKVKELNLNYYKITQKVSKPVPKSRKTVQKPKKRVKKPQPKKKIKRVKKTKKVKKSKYKKYRNSRKKIKTAKKEQNQTLPSLPKLSTLFAKKSSAPRLSSLPKSFRQLYKDEFDTYTAGQKRFLKENLNKIGEITQKYLYLRGYPYISIKTKQQGTNAVEFYLYPNGDISDLKLIDSSGYEALDKNSIETIKTAYKDYPLPSQKTKIRILVKYRLVF